MRFLRLTLLISAFSFCFTACKKDSFKENKPPIVDAGRDTTIQLTGVYNDTIALSGTAIDPDGSIIAYEWSQISGPNTAKILFPGSASTKVSGVIEGQYKFQLLATDDKGATGAKTVTILVKLPEVHVSVLQPANNSNEVFAYSYNPTGVYSGDTELPIGAWTVSGTPVSYRAYLKLDYTIPSNATIISARLSLYAMPNPHGGNNIDAQYGSANAFYIQRITTAWNPATTTWNNQPSTTTTNEITILNSTSATEDAINIDVTQLVKDMQQNANYGFAMRLLSEDYYNIRQYVSSYNSDATKRPKLVIQYTN